MSLHLTMSEFEFDQLVITKLQNKMSNAKQRGIEFRMTHAMMRDCMTATHCFYTGLAFTERRKEKKWLPTDRTIERVDNNKGYVRGNVVAVCYGANNAKAMFENATSAHGLDLRQAVMMFENIGKWLKAADES